jgi:uncharacterized protein (TIGR02246 family)
MSNRGAPGHGYHRQMKYLPLLALALLAGCGAADDAQIRALQVKLGQAMAVRDFDTALQCYAPDAVLLLPGQPRIAGREAIGKALRAALADPRLTIEVYVDRIEVDGSGRLAFGYGTGLTTMAGAAGPARSTSQWLAVFRKRDATWEIAADAFNEGAPGTH